MGALSLYNWLPEIPYPTFLYAGKSERTTADATEAAAGTGGHVALRKLKREAQWGREVRCIPALRPEGDSRIDVAVLPRKMFSLKHKVAGPHFGGQI